MKKIVIFNVGGALSSYAEFEDKKMLIDLGTGSDFSPVNDFLIPLSEQGKFIIGDQSADKDKYIIDQLFLSHLDKDHISDYENFRKYFHPHYMTRPNDNEKPIKAYKIKHLVNGLHRAILRHFEIAGNGLP